MTSPTAAACLSPSSPTPSMPSPWRRTSPHAPPFPFPFPFPSTMPANFSDTRSSVQLPLAGTRDVDGRTKLSQSRIKRKRPEKLVIPAPVPSCVVLQEFKSREPAQEERSEVQGHGYCVVSKKGWRRAMEDGYSAITHISDDPKQACFGVFDGHGGRGAVDFVTEELGKNVVASTTKFDILETIGIEEAIKTAYLNTNKKFLGQGMPSGGACVATVLVRNGVVYTANAGDCRVTLSRNGVAIPLTRDHRVENEAERNRIEKSGGYVECINGVWRVQGSLAVSRAIGDLHAKQWVISEPDVHTLRLSQDCQFLIMASDGLWDKLSDQEAVDVVLRSNCTVESCRKLVDLSASRGNKDDITIMIIDLKNFT